MTTVEPVGQGAPGVSRATEAIAQPCPSGLSPSLGSQSNTAMPSALKMEQGRNLTFRCTKSMAFRGQEKCQKLKVVILSVRQPSRQGGKSWNVSQVTQPVLRRTVPNDLPQHTQGLGQVLTCNDLQQSPSQLCLRPWYSMESVHMLERKSLAAVTHCA